MNKLSCYTCGVIFSFAGCIFLALIGAILKFQFEFVHGANHQKARPSSVFTASGVYAGLFVLLYVLLRRERSLASNVDLMAPFPPTEPQDKVYYEIRDSDAPLDRSSRTKLNV